MISNRFPADFARWRDYFFVDQTRPRHEKEEHAKDRKSRNGEQKVDPKRLADKENIVEDDIVVQRNRVESLAHHSVEGQGQVLGPHDVGMQFVQQQCHPCPRQPLVRNGGHLGVQTMQQLQTTVLQGDRKKVHGRRPKAVEYGDGFGEAVDEQPKRSQQQQQRTHVVLTEHKPAIGRPEHEQQTDGTQVENVNEKLKQELKSPLHGQRKTGGKTGALLVSGLELLDTKWQQILDVVRFVTQHLGPVDGREEDAVGIDGRQGHLHEFAMRVERTQIIAQHFEPQVLVVVDGQQGQITQDEQPTGGQNGDEKVDLGSTQRRTVLVLAEGAHLHPQSRQQLKPAMKLRNVAFRIEGEQTGKQTEERPFVILVDGLGKHLNVGFQVEEHFGFRFGDAFGKQKLRGNRVEQERRLESLFIGMSWKAIAKKAGKTFPFGEHSFENRKNNFSLMDQRKLQ